MCAFTAVACAGVAWSPAPALGADDGLLPATADIVGYKPAGGGVSAARAAVGAKLPSRPRYLSALGESFRSKGSRLTFGVFTFSSAKQATAAEKRLAGKHRRVSLTSGTRGLLRVVSTRRATNAFVLFQVDKTLAAVHVQQGTRSARARPAAVAYAGQLAAHLGRVLSLTVWQRTLDGIKSDGTFTPRLALQAFSIAYGPLPSVKRPAGATGPPVDGTLAIELVAQVWDKLTSAQQNAIDKALGAPHDPRSPRLAHAAEVITPSPVYQQLADKFNAIYRRLIPGAPSITIKAFTTTENIKTASGTDAGGEALPVDANGNWGVGPQAYCALGVTPHGTQEPPADQHIFIAHEVFHCYQYALAPGWKELKSWIMEGMADWASLVADPAEAPRAANGLGNYAGSPTEPLFERSYDAVGFWGHADEVARKGSLWPKIRAILNAGGDAAAFTVAGGESGSFTDTWASAPWGLSRVGVAWAQSDPLPLSGVLDVQVTTSNSVTSSPYALGEYGVFRDSDKPLVSVDRVQGTVRAATPTTDYGTNPSSWFCFGRCECPPGQQMIEPIPEHRNINGQYLDLALDGGSSAAEAGVVYHSLDEFCKAAPVPHTRACKLLALSGVQGYVGLGGSWYQLQTGQGDYCAYSECLQHYEEGDPAIRKCALSRGGSLELVDHANARAARADAQALRRRGGTAVKVGADLAVLAAAPDATIIWMAEHSTSARYTLDATSDRQGVKPPCGCRSNALDGARKIAKALK